MNPNPCQSGGFQNVFFGASLRNNSVRLRSRLLRHAFCRVGFSSGLASRILKFFETIKCIGISPWPDVGIYQHPTRLTARYLSLLFRFFLCGLGRLCALLSLFGKVLSLLSKSFGRSEGINFLRFLKSDRRSCKVAFATRGIQLPRDDGVLRGFCRDLIFRETHPRHQIFLGTGHNAGKRNARQKANQDHRFHTLYRALAMPKTGELKCSF